MAFEDLLDGPSTDPFLRRMKEEEERQLDEMKPGDAKVNMKSPGLPPLPAGTPPLSGSGSGQGPSAVGSHPSDKWSTGKAPDQWNTNNP